MCPHPVPIGLSVNVPKCLKLSKTWPDKNLNHCSGLCNWRWTEWSSCQVLCDLDGEEPPGLRENRTREKYFLDDPYNRCQGEREEKPCDQECQSKKVTSYKSQFLRAPFFRKLDLHVLLQRHVWKSQLLPDVEILHPCQPKLARGLLLQQPRMVRDT